jgi:hypothetical protein
MSRKSDFLLGRTFAALTQARAYFVKNQDEEGLSIVEDEYQEILIAIDNLFYKNQEKK